MKPLRIISPQFELLGEIDNYESLQFTRRHYRSGEFELHINVNKNLTETLAEDNLIMLGSDTKKVGIIRHSEVSLGQDGTKSETLIVKGYTLKSILMRRIVQVDSSGYYRNSGKVETIMKDLVNKNCITPVEPDRIIANFINATDQMRGGEGVAQYRYDNLADALEDMSNFYDIGWDVNLDITNSKFVFDVIPGKNLTAAQEVLPPVIFSTDFDNILGQNYINSGISFKNVAYAGGKGDEELRLIQKIGTASGLQRHEVFLDCSSSENVDELIANGTKSLSDLGKVISYSADIIPNNSFKYGIDYDLGDRVTVQSKKWGVQLDTRIIELKEIYEPSGFKLEATFGNEVPTIQGKIKKLNKKIIR